MEDKLKKLSKSYREIPIPDALDGVINQGLNRDKKREVIYMEKKKNNTAKWVRRASATAASLVIVLGISVNASSDLAESIYKIPVLGQIGRVITFREYKIDTDTSIGDIKVPQVEDVEDKNVEKQINHMIQERVDAILEEQAKLDEEYKAAYLETGGTEENYQKVETTVDYKKHYASDKFLSFEIFKYQTLAPAYNEKYFYNMNLETGDNLTIKDVIGDNYETIIQEEVEKEMLRRQEAGTIQYDIAYFKEMNITEDRGFYIQENGDIVVVFAKYEVAAGSEGQQDFVVGSVMQ